MDKNLEIQLFERYPILFADRDKSSRESMMCYGLSCHNGWFTLVDNLCASIEPKIRAWKDQNPDSDTHPRLAQVKEKFGGLCFYMVDLDPDEVGEGFYHEVMDLIFLAVQESYTICEICESHGEIRRDLKWHRTLCEKCYIKRKEK